MEQKELYEKLKNPAIYPGQPKAIKIIQTHISFVTLTGEHVYKIKKPVNFGFLDFTTLEKRKYFCEEELRLNQRLSPELYIEVVPIREDEENGNISIATINGKIIDYALKMKEVPQERILKEIILKNKIRVEDIKELAVTIAKFHKKAETNEEISKLGSIESIKFNCEENFEQTKNFVGRTITQEQYDSIKDATDKFLKENKELFESRIRDGKIKDCHGDLHTNNVFLADKIYVFDCIEFNKRFRYGDTCLDVAFMEMDLDYLGRKELSELFVKSYLEESNDKNMLKLLDFYKCYRAYVRGKVVGFCLDDPHISDEVKEKATKEAKKYFDLAWEYSKRF